VSCRLYGISAYAEDDCIVVIHDIYCSLTRIRLLIKKIVSGKCLEAVALITITSDKYSHIMLKYVKYYICMQYASILSVSYYNEYLITLEQRRCYVFIVITPVSDFIFNLCRTFVHIYHKINNWILPENFFSKL